MGFCGKFYSFIKTTTTFLVFGYLFYLVLYEVYIRTLRPPTSWDEYKGDWALITGSSHGIGEYFAYSLAKRGLNIILLSRTRTNLERVSKNITTLYPSIKTKIITADFFKDDVFKNIYDEVKDFKVSVLINNAGGTFGDFKLGEFGSVEMNIIEKDIKLNLLSHMQLTRSLLPKMIKNNKGRILNIASVNAISAVFCSVYGAAKAGLVRWSESMDFEFIYHKYNLRSVVSITGPTDTPLIDKIYGEKKSFLPFMVPSDEYAEQDLNLYGTSSVMTATVNHLYYYVMSKYVMPFIPIHTLMEAADKEFGFSRVKFDKEDL